MVGQSADQRAGGMAARSVAQKAVQKAALSGCSSVACWAARLELSMERWWADALAAQSVGLRVGEKAVTKAVLLDWRLADQ